jgi:tetratricopeptide (TPR) repeat protein
LVGFLEKSEYKVAYTDAYRSYQILEENKYRIVEKDVAYSRDFLRGLLLINNIAPILCFMHERSCIEEVGGFDESLTLFEDWDLWIRMSKKYDFAHIKKVTAEFRWVEDGTSSTSRCDREDFGRVREIIYDKYKEELKEAERELKKTLFLRNIDNDRKCEILVSLAMFFLYQHKIDKAEDALKEVLKLRPKEKKMIIETFYTLGSIYKREELLDKAKEKFERVISLVKEGELSLSNRKIYGGGAHFHLGVIYQRMSEREKARREFNECLRLIPNHKKAREYLNLMT